jgi:hypothetical protein
MSPKRPFNITLEPEMIEALRAYESRTGVRPAELIRRAIAAELERQGVKLAGPKVGSARRPRRLR